MPRVVSNPGKRKYPISASISRETIEMLDSFEMITHLGRSEMIESLLRQGMTYWQLRRRAEDEVVCGLE